MHRRAEDDLVAAIEELANLGKPPEKVADVPTLVGKAAVMAPGAVPVAAARRAIEERLLGKPALRSAAALVAKDLMGLIGRPKEFG